MDSAVLWAWMMTPLSGASTHGIEPMVAWHARLMTLAWGVLVPIGVLVARYWKLWPGQAWPQQLDHKGWWIVHRLVQWGAAILGTLGVYLVVQEGLGIGGVGLRGFSTHAADGTPRSSIAVFHFTLGITLVILVWLQIVAAYRRGSKGGPTDTRMRGDHYDMTPKRRRFERLHKTLGWSALVLAWAIILSGLWMADAPRWMLVGLLAWWASLFALAIRWQRQGRCIDTYQAIWGHDPQLPGLSLKPIGWGIRRIHDPSQPFNPPPRRPT
jgi:hypothetical protein